MSDDSQPRVGILMDSASAWPTVQHAALVLEQLGVEHEARVLSAHRSPHAAVAYAESAAGRGLQVLLAAAGGAAHLAGVIAAYTHLPVLGIPMNGMQGGLTDGLDALLSTAQMPAGVPVGTLAIGEAGAKNAALLAVSIMSLADPELRVRYLEYRKAQTQAVLAIELPPAGKA